MEMTDSMAVSVTALDAQRQRLNVIASNLANAQSTHTPGGGPYKRRDVVFQSTPVASPFQRTFRQVSTGPGAHALDGVKVLRVKEDTRPGQVMYDPRHPDADKKGFVKMPNINVMEEMVNMIIAQRAYEVNSRAVKVADDMMQQINNLVR